MTTLRALRGPKRNVQTLRANIPLLGSLFIWSMLILIAVGLFHGLRKTVDSITLSMWLSIAAASFPLLTNLEMRRQQLDAHALRVGYLTLGISMTVGGVVAIALHLLHQSSGQIVDHDIFRWSSVCGMVSSVMASWWLLGEPSSSID